MKPNTLLQNIARMAKFPPQTTNRNLLFVQSPLRTFGVQQRHFRMFNKPKPFNYSQQTQTFNEYSFIARTPSYLLTLKQRFTRKLMLLYFLLFAIPLAWENYEKTHENLYGKEELSVDESIEKYGPAGFIFVELMRLCREDTCAYEHLGFGAVMFFVLRSRWSMYNTKSLWFRPLFWNYYVWGVLWAYEKLKSFPKDGFGAYFILAVEKYGICYLI